MDLEIREFQEKLVSVINESHMPLEVVRLVLNEVQAKVNTAVEGNIKKQLEEKSKNKEGGESNEL